MANYSQLEYKQEKDIKPHSLRQAGHSEWSVLWFSLLIFGLTLAGYAIHSVFLLLAFLMIMKEILVPRYPGAEAIPFVLIVSWGAEIWSGVDMKLYTLIRIVCVSCILLRGGTFRKFNLFHLLCLVFGAYMLIGGVAAGYLSLSGVVNLTLCYFTIYQLISGRSRRLYLDLSLAYALGVFFSAVLFWCGPVFPRLGVIVDSMIETTNIYGAQKLTRLSGMTYDPNMFAHYILVGISAMMCVINVMDVRGKGIYYVMLAVLSLLGLLTLSKTFMLIFVLLAFLWVISFLHNCKISAWKKAGFVLMLLLAAAVMMPLMSTYVHAILERFRDGRASGDLTTGRSRIWGQYLEILGSHLGLLLFGTSPFAPMPGHSPHNFIIYMVYCFGLIGSFLFCMMIGYLIHIRKFVLKKRWIWYFMPGIMYLVFSMSVDPFMLYDAKLAMITVAAFPVKWLDSECARRTAPRGRRLRRS